MGFDVMLNEFPKPSSLSFFGTIGSETLENSHKGNLS